MEGGGEGGCTGSALGRGGWATAGALDRPAAAAKDPRPPRGADPPHTLEGRIVRLVDRVAYINHDIDDAIRAGVLRFEDLPRAEIELLGSTGSERIETLVVDLLRHSEEAADIVQGEEVGSAMLRLRSFMFERVYLGPKAQAERPRIERMLRALFAHHLEQLGDEQAVVDWLAGMTDRYAIRQFEQLSVPQGF